MTALRYLSIIICVCLLSGCSQYGLFVKQESECNCPTDIRQTVPWCAGEDAIFHCPCGPDREFYGHKPTCWGVWPAPAAQWRDAYCGPLQQEAIQGEPSDFELGEPIPTSELNELPIPEPVSNLSMEEAGDDRPLTEEPERPLAEEPEEPQVDEILHLNSFELELNNPAAQGVEQLPSHDSTSTLPANPFR